MTAQNVIEQLGLDRAVSIDSDKNNISESQFIVLNQVKEKEFGVDEVYFCTDEKGNSYPAVFIKKVNSFDTETFKEISEIHRKIWNYKKVIFLYVYSETEIRIYNCAEQPLIIKKDEFDYSKELEKLEIKSYKFSDKKNLEELNTLFSSIAIDTGIIWTIEEAESIRKKINLQRRVDKYLVESLVNTAKQLEKQGLEINFIHKIIMRSLFLLYLEDRGATDEKFYSQIIEGAKSYFDILEDRKATYDLFKKLESHFNGNVFTLDDGESINEEQLRLIKKCFISGIDNTPQTKLFEDWRLFDFNIIQIELLSEIYENFLFAVDPQKKQQTGTYYTPPSLVELILNEKLPINSYEYKYDLKILDPSCGSGIFLVESFKRLVKRYENKHKEKLTDFNRLKQLLTDNIFGIEINRQSIKVAAFSLYLALVDNLNPKTLWQSKNYRFPYLINDPEDITLKEQGKNLYRRDTIETNKEIENIEFDLVIGNPPFGTDKLLSSIRNYCDKYGFAKEMVLPFLHKATKFSPNGEIALIFNTKVLTNTGSTYQNFRKWLFNECYVEKVYNFSILRKAPKDFGGQLFGSATGPISIVFYRKETPKNASDRIIYYAPKTYIKSNVIEGVNIDSTDVKYLPREECQKPETKIWKVTMWGGMGDWNLMQKLSNHPKLSNFIEKQNIVKGLGLQFLDESTINPIKDDEIPREYILPKNIKRYASFVFSDLNEGLTEESKIHYANYYKVSSSKIPPINVFRRVGTKLAFKSSHILIKEGLSDWKVCASYIERECSFNSKVLGLRHQDTNILKGLTCFLNSQFAYYYLLLYSASIGIEREEVKPNEIYQIPFCLSIDNLYELSKMYDMFISDNEKMSNTALVDFESNINKYIFESYNFPINENVLIKDFLEFSVPLLTKQYENTLSYTKTVKSYAVKISDLLNDFLEGQNLYANTTIFNIQRFSPLMMIKISFDTSPKEIFESQEFVNDELKKIDNHLWIKEATNIYFRKKLNYKTGDDIYIIRPNQRRFWSQSMALEDASELILEILNEN
ncbi:MAG: N-6 DNA methylase [Bacteroidales bacterium]|nr:N-6 DNA methylase [Bacteroidales bacterium]